MDISKIKPFSSRYEDPRFVSPTNIEATGLTWEKFVEWTGDDRLSSHRPPRDWGEYIANHINGCVVVSKVDAWELLNEILNHA